MADTILAILGLVCAAALVLTPALIANYRRLPNAGHVGFLNFLGLLMPLVWFWALYRACQNRKAIEARAREQAIERNGGYAA
jgi:hypothetical protein